MKHRRVDLFVYGAVAALIICSCAYSFIRYKHHKADWKKSDSAEYAVEHINHADMYYWFVMRDGGAMSSVKYGQEQIKIAKEKFKDAKEARKNGSSVGGRFQEPLTKAQIDAGETELTEEEVEAKLKGIEADLENQALLHHDTFRGVFSWAHYIAEPTLFSGHRATGLYELIDQPEVIAMRDAVSGLINDVINQQTFVPQYDVLFISDPPNQQLENEALYLFNQSSRFFVNNFHAVNSALSKDEQEQVRNLNPDEKTLRKLRDKFGHNDILFVRVKQVDAYRDYHFYNAQGRVFKGDSPQPSVILNNYGFCRERNYMLLAITAFRLSAQHSSHDLQPPSWQSNIGLAVIGFIWGRTAVWGLAELVEEVMPPDETLALLAWWWPVLTGLVMVFGPAFILRFAEKRFGFLSSKFGTFNRGGALFVAIALGSCAYCGQSALYVNYWKGWYMIVPFVFVVVILAYVIGRGLDESDPVKGIWSTAAMPLVLLVGPAYCHGSTLLLWLLAIPVVGLSRATFSRSQLITTKVDTSQDDLVVDHEHSSVKELQRKAHQPPFQKTSTFETAWKTLAPWRDDGQTVRLELTGLAGMGKTALINALVQSSKDVDSNIAILNGICPEPQDGQVSESYRPIADAIAGHFSVNLLAPPEGQLIKIDKAVDHIFEEVVPFSDLLFPESEHGSSGSKTELFHSVASMLRRLSHKHRVLLIIDDTHWIDPGSEELIKYLIDGIPAGSGSAIAIITASRRQLGLVDSAETIPLAKLTREEAYGVLCDGMYLCGPIADQLLDAVSGHDDNLHWLFQMVSHLASNDVLVWQDGGFTFKDPKTKLSDHLPNDIRDSLLKAIHLKPHFRPVLECAACIGPEFTVEVLAPSVGLSRLECIRVLDELESETGIVRDLHHKDDSFAFRSSFVLEVLRQLLHVNAFGASKPSPQRIREYHSQLTGAWHSTLERSSSSVFRVASHSFAAGLRHAQGALEANLTAAHAASAQFQHEQARRYIAMARESAEHAGQSGQELELDLLLIECNEAHVEGVGRVEMAEKCLDWLELHDTESDIGVYVAAAQACYDAGIDTRDQSHFQAAAQVAAMIIERFENPLDLAEGYHFLGISLPIADKEARRENLAKALELAEGEGSQLDALRLRSRVANSLAEQLSYGSADDKLRARELFLTSIELKSRTTIRDLEGLAFAHGGLGRLAYFSGDPDFDEARTQFMEDLRYSERIGSITGQCKMHSLLGGCDVRQNKNYQSALDHYRQAYDFADERVDQFFALGGILECAGHLSNKQIVARFGPPLVELANAVIADLPEDVRLSDPKSAIPRMCVAGLQAGLDASSGLDAGWHRWMTQLLTENKIS
jgi:tetratricopeptide (TPR) repeat protein